MARFPILMYHKIGVPPEGAKVPHHYVSVDRFKRQIRAILRFGFKTTHVSTQEPDVKKPICLTFDDGYQNFQLAASVLEDSGQTGTVFVVTDLLGRDNRWDVETGDVPEPLLSADEVLNLHGAGFEFGSHTVTHARLAQIDQNLAKQEIVRSKEFLDSLLGSDTQVFCYPYGSHDSDVRLMVQKAGYKWACSVEKGWNDGQTDPFRLKRVNVRRDTSTAVLFWKLWSQARRRTQID